MKDKGNFGTTIRSVSSTHVSNSSVLDRLRNTIAGQIYLKYLKSFGPVQMVTQWIWNKGYPFYVKHLSYFILEKKCRRRLPLTKLKDYIKKNEIPTFRLVAATEFNPPTPKVFPNTEQHNLLGSLDDSTFPEIYVAVIKNVLTYGSTNLILADNEVICHDLYDFKRDSTSEELHGRILINPESMNIRWLSHDRAPTEVPEAAAFVDACASNYAHWMSEVLPRLALFCADVRFKDVPIVVNEGLHENIMQSLLLVAGSGREIILLPVGRALAVRNLYLTSVTGYVPFDKRSNKLLGHSQGVFSPAAFDALCNFLNAQVVDSPGESWPEKVFLRRNSGTRVVTNMAELEKIVSARGYEVIEPEKLTFVQQIKLFKSAKIIISPTGAALCNAIFCKPGTHIAILMSKHEDMIYRYWSNMLSSRQVNVLYVLGNIDKNQHLGIHGDFSVSPSDFLDLMEAVEEE